MFVSILAPFLATAAQATDFGGLHVYREWVVGCDNRRECHATSLPYGEDSNPSPGGDGNLGVSVRRSAAPDAALRINIGILSEGDYAPISAIMVDGRAVAIPFRESGGVIDLSGTAATELVQAMRNGGTLALADSQGREIASASLYGLTASLLYMDDRQRRVGTVSALARPGNRPANASTIPVPAADPAIVVNPEPAAPPVQLRRAELQTLMETDPCRSFADDQRESSPYYARLDSETTLMLLHSYCMGYNAEDRIFIIDNRGVARPAPFGSHPLSGAFEEAGGPALPGGSWNSEQRLLSSFGRARGLGDCGELMQFVWDSEAIPARALCQHERVSWQYRLYHHLSAGSQDCALTAGCSGSEFRLTTGSKVLEVKPCAPRMMSTLPSHNNSCSCQL